MASRTSPIAFAADLPALAHDDAHQGLDARLHYLGGTVEAGGAVSRGHLRPFLSALFGELGQFWPQLRSRLR